MLDLVQDIAPGILICLYKLAHGDHLTGEVQLRIAIGLDASRRVSMCSPCDRVSINSHAPTGASLKDARAGTAVLTPLLILCHDRRGIFHSNVAASFLGSTAELLRGL